jgi:uncharacterized protein involved in exopolysaccharide biosynthesis
LREYLRVLVEQKKLIGIITAVSTLLALLAAFLITPIYRAEVLLAPVTQEKTSSLSALAGQFGDLAALAGVNLGDDNKSKTAESIAALKSRALSVAFINQESLKSVLFPRKWDAEKKKWKDPDDVPTDWEAFEVFDRNIRTVQVDRRTGLVTFAIEWKDPTLATKWANGLVRAVNSSLRNRAISDAEKNIGFLEKQLASTSSVEIQQAIYRLIETQAKKKMIANTQEEYAFSVIDPAVIPEKRARPKRKLIVVMGITIGLLFGVTLVFARDKWSAGSNTKNIV